MDLQGTLLQYPFFLGHYRKHHGASSKRPVQLKECLPSLSDSFYIADATDLHCGIRTGRSAGVEVS